MTLSRYHDLADQAAGYLIQKYSPSGRRIGWLMIASIFIEAWGSLLHFVPAGFSEPGVPSIAAAAWPGVGRHPGGRDPWLTGLVPIAAAAMLWGHYWDAENVMTIPSMVAAPRHKGIASGFGYIHNKLPAFLGIFLFPSFFGSI